jgi:hypothetical protein
MLCEIANSMQYPHTNGWVDQYGPSVGIVQLCKTAQEFLVSYSLSFLKLESQLLFDVSEFI